ncbi:15442_t:CDS:2 [Cetraspora pellucida]|uniref:15442_t:CDS:1 n=1 Tax=Cetraspora pellucida TaxID=1433469 RepID=A0A9N9AA41_9GLOM|nr:15442_t:CDS:2 [Cetraspora pellucida]
MIQNVKLMKFGIREKGKSGIGENDKKLSIPDDEESWTSLDDTLSLASTTSSNETVFTSSSKPSSFKSRDFYYELCTQGYLNIVEKCKCGKGENEFPTFFESN